MTTSPTATWSFSINGLGTVQAYTNEYYYAGGFAIVGIGPGNGTGWQIFNLGGGSVALMVGLTDENGDTRNFYWSSHDSISRGPNDGGMMLWYYISSGNNYISDSIGPEQTFALTNLGGGNVALQATAGAYSGQYLAGQSGGWYPSQYSLGSGSFVSSSDQAALLISGAQLPILLITNSGYQLDLSNQSLAGLSLAGADMRGCNLQGADLSGVTAMTGTDFTGASLRGANLAGQALAGPTWSQADFTGTNLTTIAGADAAQLSSAIFNQANLTNVSFVGASLTGAQLQGATLDGANLSNADLSSADLTGASLKGTNFTGANLQGTIFNGCDLTTAQLDASPQFTRAPANRTTFQGATVPFAVLNSNWSYLDLTDATITGLPTQIASLVADGALLPSGLSLQGMDLQGASFQATQMYEIQLQTANLQGANLSNALLKGAKLTGANLTLANLDSAWLIAEQTGDVAQAAAQDQLEAAIVSDAFLFNTILDGAHCDGVDFSGSFFATATVLGSSQAASAVGATMSFTKFNNATLVLAVFNGAQLSAANFASSSLVGASFQDNGSQATQLNPSSDVTHTAASVYNADLRGTNFSGANMDGLDMRGAVESATGGSFMQVFQGYKGVSVPVSFDYGATVLGNTTSSTTCSDGSSGPCTIPAALR